MEAAETVSRESEEIVWPAISIVGAATPQKFFAAFRQGDRESGFANRFLIFHSRAFGGRNIMLSRAWMLNHRRDHVATSSRQSPFVSEPAAYGAGPSSPPSF